MNLSVEQITKNESSKLSKVYQIIKNSGEHMYKEEGLAHWRTPYPIEAIQKDCEEGEVFLVKDLNTNSYVNTFQLKFIPTSTSKSINNKKEGTIAVINKFATIPEVSGKGIGKFSMKYIEEYCRNKRVTKICLDVYDKSEHAVQFYKKRGFVITGSKPTRHFTVYLMNKQL